jgi:NTP pyrophosphatase (non-canonical NTP hydrolase)
MTVDPFLEEMIIELDHAESKHPAPHSLHEAYGVILEEVDEFWDEVKKQTSARDPEHIKKELVQIAAMCWRCYKDVLPKVREEIS